MDHFLNYLYILVSAYRNYTFLESVRSMSALLFTFLMVLMRKFTVSSGDIVSGVILLYLFSNMSLSSRIRYFNCFTSNLCSSSFFFSIISSYSIFCS